MAAEIFRFEDFELDRGAYELRRAGRSVRLERIPLDLLFLLVERQGQLVTRQEIVDRVWSKGVFLDTEHGINTAARKIRLALSDNPEVPRFVLTVPAKGYRFVASVEKTEPAVAAAQAVAVQREKPAVIESPRGRSHWRILTPALAFLAALVTMSFFHFHRAQALTEKDTVVLADFANSTGDPVFDDTLKQALSVQLEQSPFLSILSDKKMSETLQMMGRPADEPVSEKTGLEICQRTGSAAVLGSTIAKLGSEYVVGLNVVGCRTGNFLAKQQVRANRKEDVLKAVDQAATRLRGELGESLSALQIDVPLEEATTPSLEALKAFSLGAKALDGGDFTASVTALQRAIALDPNFALAYGALAANYANLSESGLAIENSKKAYELRERVTEREKFAIESGYYTRVTGDAEKARQTYELCARTYPRDASCHFNLGNLYNNLGQHEKALAEALESFRLSSHESIDYGYLAFAYSTVGRLKEARTTVEEALAKNLDSPALRTTMYPLAFLQNDAAGMAEQVAWAAGKPGVEDVLLAMEADTAAYYGQLKKALEFSRRAVASAERAEKKETAAGYEANAALREALFGNMEQAQKRAATALKLSTGRDSQYGAALAQAFSGDTAQAQKLGDNLAKQFSEDTIVKFHYLPTIRTLIALNRNDASKAIEILQAAGSYELGIEGQGGLAFSLYPVYVRGQAYLAARDGSNAAIEFQKILDHRGIVLNSPIGALAHLQIGRAYAMQGDTLKARAAYNDFLTLWKDADPDIPILKEAKAEYAKLQ